jgi:hypothetical protein
VIKFVLFLGIVLLALSIVSVMCRRLVELLTPAAPEQR